jgi:hypothetical protein
VFAPKPPVSFGGLLLRVGAVFVCVALAAFAVLNISAYGKTVHDFRPESNGDINKLYYAFSGEFINELQSIADLDTITINGEPLNWLYADDFTGFADFKEFNAKDGDKSFVIKSADYSIDGIVPFYTLDPTKSKYIVTVSKYGLTRLAIYGVGKDGGSEYFFYEGSIWWEKIRMDFWDINPEIRQATK